MLVHVQFKLQFNWAFIEVKKKKKKKQVIEQEIETCIYRIIYNGKKKLKPVYTK